MKNLLSHLLNAPRTCRKIITAFLLTVFLGTLIPAHQVRAQAKRVSPLLTTAPYTYLSPVKKAPLRFTALALGWHQQVPAGTSAEVWVHFRYGNAWSTWYKAEQDLDGMQNADREHPVTFLPVNATDTFQYRVVLTSANAQSPLVENIEFTYMNAGQKLTMPEPQSAKIVASLPRQSSQHNTLLAATTQTSNLLAQTTTSTSTTIPATIPVAIPANGLKIITRAEWGADESLRLYKENNTTPKLVNLPSDFAQKYADELKISRVVDRDDNGQLLTWPLQYAAKVSKIIIHHTDTTKNLDNPMQAIRDIYYWHTVVRGWGDIGYNYIIDPQGNIYEGRYGGDGVVGAHAGPGNVGSIGIAVLGDYEDNEVPAPVLKSLVALIKAKTTQFHIDPLGKSSFRGQIMPNIMGHRDVMATDCPGSKLYDKLGFIAMSVQNGFEPKIIDKAPYLPVNKQYDFSLNGTIPFLQFEPGAKQTVTISLKNNGPGTWGVGTALVLSRDQNAQTFFIMDSVVTSAPLDHEVKPGEIANFSLTLQANYEGGFATIELAPLINGTIKVEKYINFPVEINQPQYDYEVADISIKNPVLKRGVLTEATIALKNTGNITWHQSGSSKFALGADNPRDHFNKLLLKPGTRLGDLVESEVKPGEIGHVKISLKAPRSEGLYQEYFTPLLEGLHWFTNKKSSFSLYVYAKEYAANFIDMMPDRTTLPGEQKAIWLRVQNVGGVTWTKQGNQQLNFTLRNPQRLPIGSMQMEEDQVAPGQFAKIVLTVNAPLSEGLYPLWITPKIKNANLTQQPINIGLQVKKSSTSETALRSGQNGNSSAPSDHQNAGQNVTTTSLPIRIDLSFSDNPVISADGPFALQNGEEDRATFAKDEKVKVSYDQGSYTISGPHGSFVVNTPPRFYSPSGAILRVDNWDRSSSVPAIKLNEFRGILEMQWYNNELHTINELPLEDYLKGTGETNESQPAEKLKAVIVLARSYAMYYLKIARKFPGAPFDLSDDPATSQKYVGYDAEKRSPNTVKAVNDTSGMVVTYQGKVIKTPYFHSDDGRTRSAEEVWGWKDTPYLVSVSDPYCQGQTLQGHGVGLSGCGSLGMAKAGKSFIEIIRYYFQGVEVQKLNEKLSNKM